MTDSIAPLPRIDDELHIYFNTRDAVPLEQIGQFLLAFGREMQESVGPGYVLELADVEYNSLDFLFRRRPKQQIKGKGKGGQLSQKQKDQLALDGLHQQKKSNLLQAATLAMTTIGVAIAAYSVLKDNGGTQAVVQQKNKPSRTIPIDQFKYVIECDERDRKERRALPMWKERQRLMEYLRAGENFSLAGYVMPRKSNTFRTAKGNQYSILEMSDGVRPGDLLRVWAEAARGPDGEVGLILHDFERLDDK